MAAEFIGSTILITLCSPQGAQVRGVVADIVEQDLTLQNVVWIASGRSGPDLTMKGTSIADLEILPEAILPTNLSVLRQQGPPPLNKAEAIPVGLCDIGHIVQSHTSSLHGVASRNGNSVVAETTAQSFVDPAIISLQRPPLAKDDRTDREQVLMVDRPLASSPLLDDGIRDKLPYITPTAPLKPAVPFTTKPKPVVNGIPSSGISHSMTTATLSEPFGDLTLTATTDTIRGRGAAELGVSQCREGFIQPGDKLAASVENTARQTGKRLRRRRSKGNPVKGGPLPLGVEGASPIVTRILQRQTPNPKSRRQPFAEGALGEVGRSLKNGSGSVSVQGQGTPRLGKQSHRERLQSSEATYGWATEDATDIQEMGEFDFEANLSKFDKREVFNQFRHDDTTADEARLVSHNKLPSKPGTAGGKNLHFTENVLDSPKINGHAKWNSEAGESEGNSSDEARASGGKSLKRSGSRSTLRKPPSRKGSAFAAGDKSRTSTTSLNATQNPLFDLAGSPKPKQNISTSPYAGSMTISYPTLRIQTSNKLCPCLSPLQMVEFEQFAISDLGMTEEMMTENAGRGIAETAVHCLRDPDTDPKGEITGNPHIIVTAGNHKSGARAMAGARHLRNHGFRVTACILGGEHEDELLDSVRQQALAYRKSGGALLTPAALLDGLKGDQINPRLIIDALLGYHACFEDLRRDQQANYFELVLWVNRNEFQVMSIDVPSGLDASNGELTLVNSKPLAFFPKVILSLGVPKPWLLPMMAKSSPNTITQLFLADIGISNVAWKRMGKRRSRGVDFAGEWVVRLRYQGGVE